MKYRVIFRGEVEKGRDIDLVKKKLSVVFKSDFSEIETLFSGKKMVVLKNSTREMCEKLRKVGKRCGAIFYVEDQEKKEPVEHKTAPPMKCEPEEGYCDPDLVARVLRGFSIFHDLRKREIELLAPLFKKKKFSDGEVVLKKGESGNELFVIVSGRVNVVNDDETIITSLGSGEILGEMSLFSGSPVGAGVRAAGPLTVLYMKDEDLKSVLPGIPSLQFGFTRLLAKRMAEISRARSDELASSMAGKLSEMPPAELLQTLNINQKTGVLTFKPAGESATLSFRDGQIIAAQYGGKEGREAFFDILRIGDGRFQFLPGLADEDMEADEIGDFTFLLMEGLRRMDEENEEIPNSGPEN